MVRELRDNTNLPDTYKEYMGLSTDQKPTSCGVNSLFYELNTKKVYYFDGSTWKEIGA